MFYGFQIMMESICTDGLGNLDVDIVEATDLFVGWGRHAHGHADRHHRHCSMARCRTCESKKDRDKRSENKRRSVLDRQVVGAQQLDGCISG